MLKGNAMSLRQFVLLGVAFASVAAVAQRPVPPLPAPPRTIAVTGSAERMVTPDVALIVLAIQTQADTVGKAVAANNTTAAPSNVRADLKFPDASASNSRNTPHHDS